MLDQKLDDLWLFTTSFNYSRLLYMPQYNLKRDLEHRLGIKRKP